MSEVSLSPSGQDLQGKRILITRPRDIAAAAQLDEDVLQQRLQQCGAQVHWLPLIEIHPILSLPAPDGHSTGFGDESEFSLAAFCQGVDWLFFTSKNAVHVFFRQLSQHTDAAVFERLKIAVIGPTTAACVAAYGFSVSYMAPQYHAEIAAKAFCEQMSVQGLHILWPCGNRAHQALSHILQAAGARVTPIVVYETRLKSELNPEELALIQAAWDVVVFTSPSAIQAWVNLTGPIGRSSSDFAIASLGPKTTEAACQLLGRADILAETHTLTGLAEAICSYWMEDPR